MVSSAELAVDIKVVRGRFVHDEQGFAVQAGQGKASSHYAREDAASLYTLLTAPSRQTGGDRPAGFWSAQLVHYGLPYQIKKEDAKKALLAAFKVRSGNSAPVLKVPGTVLATEKELAKEFKQALKDNKKDQLDAIKQEKERLKQEVAKQKEAARLQVEKFKGREKTLKEAKGKKRVTEETFSTNNVKRSTSAMVEDDSRAVASTSVKQVSRGKTKMNVKKEINDELEVDRKPAAKRVKLEEAETKISHTSGALGQPSKVSIKTSGQSNKKAGPSKEVLLHEKLGLIAGKWKIQAPYITEQWPDYSQDMFIDFAFECPGQTSKSIGFNATAICGQFDMGVTAGYIYTALPAAIKSKPNSGKGLSLRVTWRGRETGEGQIEFDDADQYMQLSFAETGLTFKGVAEIPVAGTVAVTGQKVREDGAGGNYGASRAFEYKEEFMALDESAWYRESRSRWH